MKFHHYKRFSLTSIFTVHFSLQRTKIYVKPFLKRQDLRWVLETLGMVNAVNICKCVIAGANNNIKYNFLITVLYSFLLQTF